MIEPVDRELADLITQWLRERLDEIARNLAAVAIAKLRAGLPVERALQEAAAEAAAQVDQAEAAAHLALRVAIGSTGAGKGPR